MTWRKDKMVPIRSTAPIRALRPGLAKKAVTICFRAGGGVIVFTGLFYGETGQDNVVYTDSFTHSSPEPTCYEVTPGTPTVISGPLYVYLGLSFGDPPSYLDLFSVRVTLGT